MAAAKLALSLATTNFNRVDGPQGQRELGCEADAGEQLGMKIENCHFERPSGGQAVVLWCVCQVLLYALYLCILCLF